MVNSPQSSRRKRLQTILPNVAVASKTVNRSYTISGTPTESGEVDIHFNQLQEAKPINYILLLGALIGGTYLLYKGMVDVS